MDFDAPLRPRENTFYVEHKEKRSWIPKEFWAKVALCWSFAQLCLSCGVEIAISYGFYDYMSKLQTLNPLFESTPSLNLVFRSADAIKIYHFIFMAAQVFQFVLLYDAVLNLSLIQLVATTAFNFAFMVYSVIQLNQAANLVGGNGLITRGLALHPTANLEYGQIAIMIIFCTGWLFIAYRLYKVFGWTIFKEMGADVSMRNKLWLYHVYIMILKIDVFFFLGFSFQYLFMVSIQYLKDRPSIPASPIQFYSHLCIATPIAMALLVVSYYAVRKENYILMYGTFGGLVAAMIYLIVKLVDIYTPSSKDNYSGAQNSLTLFIVLTFIMAGVSVVVAFFNFRNFGTGLKEQLDMQAKEGAMEMEHREKTRWSLD
ncbi:hypothetical protein EDD86DRAFT_269239 [Gorgonomyces haynaldii]|nr:hypothetical protein EDD86DRAFT_269239 [Gorgonomyces haynaldii]